MCTGGATLFSLPGRRVRLFDKPWIHEEQCFFNPHHETLDHFYMLEGAWDFAQPVRMCSVNPEKGYDHWIRCTFIDPHWEKFRLTQQDLLCWATTRCGTQDVSWWGGVLRGFVVLGHSSQVQEFTYSCVKGKWSRRMADRL